jgi:Cysteine rich repeat
MVLRLGWAERRQGNRESDMRHSAIGAIGALFVLTLFSPAALAQNAAAPPGAAPSMPSPPLKAARAKMRAACAADVEKFCAGVERGNGALRHCLRAHRAELSSDCVSARAGLRSLRASEKAKDKS